MTSLAPLIFNYCSINNKTIFLCGGSESDINEFVIKVKEAFPKLSVSGYLSGYQSEEEIISKLIMVETDFVLLGLGNKKQEEVLLRARDLKKATYFTCGAFISQTVQSKGMQYYPKLYDQLNLRWLYRLIKEKQTRKRVLIYYPKFFLAIIVDWLKAKVRN
jgi:N-acetylglucosaminyldiphosphoundecaprenol N-acetyl-beta-D-mannosaminyltransferase